MGHSSITCRFRSVCLVVSALAGAIVSIELYKKFNGINARTGAVYALPIALGISVGRIGCLLSGMEDFTYGVPTEGKWGWDFGDSIPRHPVQLYEAASMSLFALVYVAAIRRGSLYWRTNGFYLAVAFYGVQRFILEFLKPYEPLAAGLTVFQFLSLALACYGIAMVATRDKAQGAADGPSWPERRAP